MSLFDPDDVTALPLAGGIHGTFHPEMRISRILRTPVIALLLVLAMSGVSPLHAAQGVDDGEILVGTHADLTGPLQAWGASIRNGIDMAFSEINESGGIEGRMLRLVMKDDGYDPSAATAAVRDLIDKDRVFALLSPLATPLSIAAATEAVDRNIPYLFPLTPTDQTPELQSPYMFALAQPLEEVVAEGLRNAMEIRRGAKIGVLATGDMFGRGVRAGVIRQLYATGLSLTADITFAQGATDYSLPLKWLREQDVGLIVLGAAGEDVIAIMQTARAMRWQPTFLCPSSCYTPELAALGGEVVEGLYAVSDMPIPYPNDRVLGAWAHDYQARYGVIASRQALTAYRNARFFLAALTRAGRTPTQENFRHALETMPPWTDPLIGGMAIRFSADNHQAQTGGFLAQARGGRWSVVVQRSPTRL